MNSSTLRLDAIKNKMISGIDKEGEMANNWEGGILSGALGIASTANDMTRFIKHTIDPNNPIANLQTKPTFQIQENHFVGLGWGIRHLENGTRYNHGGGSKGFSCYMKINRAKKDGMILLTNVSAFNKHQKSIDELSNRLCEHMNF